MIWGRDGAMGGKKKKRETFKKQSKYNLIQTLLETLKDVWKYCFKEWWYNFAHPCDSQYSKAAPAKNWVLSKNRHPFAGRYSTLAQRGQSWVKMWSQHLVAHIDCHWEPCGWVGGYKSGHSSTFPYRNPHLLAATSHPMPLKLLFHRM